MTLVGWKERVGLAFFSFSFNFCKVLNSFLLLPSFPFLPLSHGSFSLFTSFAPEAMLLQGCYLQFHAHSSLFFVIAVVNKISDLGSTFSPQCWSFLFSEEILTLCYIYAHRVCLSHFGYPQTRSGSQNSIVSPV